LWASKQVLNFWIGRFFHQIKTLKSRYGLSSGVLIVLSKYISLLNLNKEKTKKKNKEA
jgi:hypothetical protein